jgi:hypothetical protein
MRRSQPFWTAILVIALLPTMGCLFRTRPVEETYSKVPLKESTQAALIESINQQAQRIQSLQATVDIDTSVGGAKKGHVTDYKEIRGYVLARKPAMLHMIGLLPIVRNSSCGFRPRIASWLAATMCRRLTQISRWRTSVRATSMMRC